MRILVLGLSRIVRKRLLPALAMLPQIESVDIATRSGRELPELPLRIRRDFYNDYDEAIDRSNADLVYISIVNSQHTAWATRALESGRHVVIDKPAAPTVEQATHLVDLATKRNLCVAEATVFGSHPQLDTIQQLIHNISQHSLRISATFSFPSMDPHDFRYSQKLGGGALSDLGPYAAATARLFFPLPPNKLYCQILSRAADVDTAFATLMTFPGGGTLLGRFGFDTEYRNHLSIISPGISIDLERAYTAPADQGTEIIVRRNNIEERLAVKAADAFNIFLQGVFTAIATSCHAPLALALLSDASLIASMRKATEE